MSEAEHRHWEAKVEERNLFQAWASGPGGLLDAEATDIEFDGEESWCYDRGSGRRIELTDEWAAFREGLLSALPPPAQEQGEGEAGEPVAFAARETLVRLLHDACERLISYAKVAIDPQPIYGLIGRIECAVGLPDPSDSQED